MTQKVVNAQAIELLLQSLTSDSISLADTFDLNLTLKANIAKHKKLTADKFVVDKILIDKLKELLADSYEAVAYNDCAYLVTTDDIKPFAEAHELSEDAMEAILFDNNLARYLDEELNNYISCNLPDDED